MVIGWMPISVLISIKQQIKRINYRHENNILAAETCELYKKTIFIYKAYPKFLHQICIETQ